MSNDNQQTDRIIIERPHKIKVATLNVAGIKNHIEDIFSYIIEESISFIACQETWLSKENETELPKKEFIIIDQREHKSRRGRTKSGIMIIFNPYLASREQFKIKNNNQKNNQTWFEFKDILFGVFYISPNCSIDQYENEFSNLIGYAHKEKIVIMGDFNTRLGNITGDISKTPGKSVLLLNLLSELGISYVKPRNDQDDLWTFSNHLGKSIIDFFFTNDRILTSGITTKVSDQPIAYSDHKPIVAEIVCNEQISNICEIYKYNISKLRYSEYWNSYVDIFESGSESVIEQLLTPDINLNPQEWVNEKYQKIQDLIKQAADQTIGMKLIGKKK